MKHTFFTLTLFLLALLSTSCGNKKVAYQNPLPMAFGDPFLLKASDGKYYMYGTGGVSNGFKVYSSDDLVTWTDEGPIYQGGTSDSWTTDCFWAPEVYVESFIPLHPVAEQILSLYNTTDDGRPIFPLPNRNRLWYCIHEIGILAGVKENLSYHASRHSFGTLTLSAGVPIESISKMMGHTNIRTTQGYAKVTDDKISEDMDKLMEKRRKNLTDSGHDNQ